MDPNWDLYPNGGKFQDRDTNTMYLDPQHGLDSSVSMTCWLGVVGLYLLFPVLGIKVEQDCNESELDKVERR